MTRQLLKRLEERGDVSPHQANKFYHAVWVFYSTAATYALANLPLEDTVLKNSQDNHKYRTSDILLDKVSTVSIKL